MKRHTLLLPLLMCLGSGCSSMDSLLAFDDRPAPEPVAIPAVVEPAPAAEAPDAFCRRVAAGARSQAVVGGFDASTQERIEAQSYQQCLSLSRAG